MPNETLPQPAHLFRMSYCSYCVHQRAEHILDRECARCIIEGNGWWPDCPRFTRQAKTPAEMWPEDGTGGNSDRAETDAL